ncbi:MAG TPA: dihydrofolate reductase family protein [Acidobacteriota bacterium]
MSKLKFVISMSLDGFIAGPNQSPEDPLGVGGKKLHEWAFPLKAFKELHGGEGGEVNESNSVVEEMFANVGATIMGRNMFGGYPGPWNPENPWDGWWGNNPPFHHPVFVVTHFEREPLKMEGGTTFIFVTSGIQDALTQARKAANGKDVHLGGGANVAQQYLSENLIDEMNVSLVPIFLGSGERLFKDMSNEQQFELVRTIPAKNVTHLKYRFLR